MSRLSFRPRPLDIHKKLPIVKSIKDFEEDELPSSNSTSNSQLQRIALEAENEGQQVSARKTVQEIPIPRFDIVDTYERDYTSTFVQPTSYLRARGARADLGEFVEYDLDNQDDDWIQEFNNERMVLTPEKFEAILFKLEVLDHKTRERAGIINLSLGSPVPVLLRLDAAAEATQSQSIRYVVLQSIYNYWKKKREHWQKPILQRLQPPPAVNDTNPYNVFRPREKSHRLHTRRMQRRENNVQSFEKLRQVRRKLDQAKIVLSAVIKREEKKRQVIENEVNLQQVQMKYKHDAQIIEDGMLPSFSDVPCKFGSSEEDFSDSDDATYFRPHGQPYAMHGMPFSDLKLKMKKVLKHRRVRPGWLQKRDPLEPVLLFTKPLDPEKLAAAGIVQPPDPPVEIGSTECPYRCRGRIGRGGRIIFDRWNPLLRSPIGPDISSFTPVNSMPPHGDG